MSYEPAAKEEGEKTPLALTPEPDQTPPGLTAINWEGGSL